MSKPSGTRFGQDRVYLIAEAGVNHNGDVALAERIVDLAAEAGADAVKFQTFRAERLVSPAAGKAAYQKAHTAPGESQFEMLRRLELDWGAHERLLARCRERGVDFVSSPFDADSARGLAALGVPFLKVPSGEVVNVPLLRVIGSLGLPVVLSTGMATLEEVRAGLAALLSGGLDRGDVTVLQCNTEYPTPFADVNLRAMQTMARELDVRVGYSDHTPGVVVPAAAVALGARLVEKHFTLDKSLPGPDHAASLCPEEFAEMVRAVRIVEAALGDGVKRPSPSEQRNLVAVRQSIVAARDIRPGETFTGDNLTTRRPGSGISPLRWDEVVGTRAGRAFRGGEVIEP